MKPLAINDYQAELHLITLCDIAAHIRPQNKSLESTLTSSRRKRKMALRRPAKTPMTTLSV